MSRWAALLGPGFGVDDEPVRERPETFEAAGAEFARLADDYQSLVGSARVALWRTEGNDLSGRAADAFHALVDGLVQDLTRVPDHLREVQRILSAHADELDGLRRRSERELGRALQHRLEPDAELSDPSSHWLAVYRELRESEDHLNRRTTRSLLDLRFSDVTRAVSVDARPIEVWRAIAPVLAGHGAEIVLPSPEARRVDCVSVDDRGVPTVHVDGPAGGPSSSVRTSTLRTSKSPCRSCRAAFPTSVRSIVCTTFR